MELIYAYIEKYRTFEKQQISFSNKFIVNYENGKLSIERNSNYIDVYPGNVVNITGIVGKNATGKSSLLSLIGKKIDDRWLDNEIYIPEYTNPHNKFSLLDIKQVVGNEEIKYKNKYFMIYFYGQNENKEDIFVFETNCVIEYKKIFENHEILYELLNRVGAHERYWVGNGWFPIIFKSQGTSFIMLQDVSELDCQVSILNFLPLENKKILDQKEDYEEEDKISLKRRYCYLTEIYEYNKVKFLIEKMNQCDDTMFSQTAYTVEIKFKNIEEHDHIINRIMEKKYEKKAVFDYVDYINEDFTLNQKNILAILNAYVNYWLSRLLTWQSETSDTLKKWIDEFCKIEANIGDDYEMLKYKYFLKTEKLDELYCSSSPKRKKFLRLGANLLVDEFEYAFKYGADNNLKWTYNTDRLELEITKESNIESVITLFKNVLDENCYRSLRNQDSMFRDFIEIEILQLSEGESENLSLYVSLNEAMNDIRYPKKDYILLLDEIEKSMHPEMCRTLVDNLMKFLKAYKDKKFQIIISSHSPFIVSDLLKENVVCLDKKNGKTEVSKPESSPFGQNIHMILKNQFFLKSTYGQYSREIIELIQNCLEEKDKNKAITHLADFYNYEQYPKSVCEGQEVDAYFDGDHMNMYSYSYDECLNWIEKLINCIGEDILRKYFLELLDKKRKEESSVETQIEYHERMIKELKKLKERKKND